MAYKLVLLTRDIGLLLTTITASLVAETEKTKDKKSAATYKPNYLQLIFWPKRDQFWTYAPDQHANLLWGGILT